MNVVRENLENQTALLRIAVGEADYKEQVDKQLKDYKRKANVPGFRPGMVPMGIINKMYRKSVVADSAYRKATDAAFEYIKENGIETVGDLMPSEKQGELDFDNGTDFEFVFEIGLAPEVELALTKKNSLTKYVIEPNDDMRKGFRSNYMRRFGKLADVDVVADDEALTGTLTQGETTVEDAYVGLISMDEEARKPFIGKKVGDTIEVDVNEIYKTPSQRASILGVKEAELEGMDPKYTFTITQIRKFVEPEMNEEFFKLAFPAGDVTTPEQFDAKIDEQVRGELAKETEFKFTADMRKYLLEKTNLSLPEEFLKNWLYRVNEGKFSMEEIEKEFPQFLDMLRWDLIRRKVMKANNLEITQDDVKAEAKEVAMMQFQYYGMHTVADDMLENFVNSILGNKEEVRKIYDKVGEHKVIDAVAAQIKVNEKTVSPEEFQKLA
ncbi:trigger factor [Rikenella microfusus]|uniref:trigger factor n=1 Tax=Rikenella microfusus TaxID=28139 RepID=UPI001DBE9789|nr:trigger factor [Rikenella microfusus]HJE87868.1 trigger factor [Rikenella microfusus]